MALNYSPPCPPAPRTRSVRRTVHTATLVKPAYDLRQQLFPAASSVSSDINAVDLSAKEAVQTTMNKVQIDHDVELALRSQQRDLHEQRLKKLRELLKVIANDDWMYASADKLIGLK